MNGPIMEKSKIKMTMEAEWGGVGWRDFLCFPPYYNFAPHFLLYFLIKFNVSGMKNFRARNKFFIPIYFFIFVFIYININ